MRPPLVGRLVVVGLGLIGGSFAKGLRESGLCREVVGVDLDPESRKLAVELGVVDRCEDTLAAACVGADVIQLAVPILAMEKLLAVLATLDLGDAVLTDVGSAKGNVVRAAREAFGAMPPRFVPGHPIAGSEQSGVEASNAQLFRRHKVILTPLADTDPAALAVVDRLWTVLGADVEHMQVERHDEVLAATSHLPHLLAFGLVDSLAKRNENLEIFRYAAGGFRDFTRIAGSDPVMWHDIFLANREAVLRTLDTFRTDLDALRDAVDAGDGQQLMGVFTRARTAREHFGEILARRAGTWKSTADTSVLLTRAGGEVNGRIHVSDDIACVVAYLVGACISVGSVLRLEQVLLDAALVGVIDFLRLMGADITLENQREVGEQPVADLRVRYAPLSGIEIPEALVPRAMDEFPVLFVAAASAQGRTVLHGAQAAQVRQSLRIQAICDALAVLGVKIESTVDGVIIEGGTLGGGEVHAHGDHRVAMALSIASLRATAPIRISDCAGLATSFPHFLALCAQVGIRVAQEGQS
ncbi:prephenate dehydrogenase/arogenate dehydrogenase family protein [Pseudomonas huanghezhanensis]|uniref:prephenate dehydrogenase/arogenate dehydrogenase family protein n=1 Tax=Pseudomonas huanghezhanensis TaxID=3002903 RepID=UPI0022868D00|nr:prephenate dehydrogenase/arogenate dehydrogenase family protein [Pseudomonas sp. BSw22131]